MITREQAEQAAGQIFGPSEEDGHKNWELIEFDAGWLILRSSALDPTLRGGAMRVIERDSGRIMVFPSYVPTDYILSDYANVVDNGYVEGQAASS
jgi:hypothetical protein